MADLATELEQEFGSLSEEDHNQTIATILSEGLGINIPVGSLTPLAGSKRLSWGEIKRRFELGLPINEGELLPAYPLMADGQPISSTLFHQLTGIPANIFSQEPFSSFEQSIAASGTGTGENTTTAEGQAQVASTQRRIKQTQGDVNQTDADVHQTTLENKASRYGFKIPGKSVGIFEFFAGGFTGALLRAKKQQEDLASGKIAEYFELPPRDDPDYEEILMQMARGNPRVAAAIEKTKEYQNLNIGRLWNVSDDPEEPPIPVTDQDAEGTGKPLSQDGKVWDERKQSRTQYWHDYWRGAYDFTGMTGKLDPDSILYDPNYVNSVDGNKKTMHQVDAIGGLGDEIGIWESPEQKADRLAQGGLGDEIGIWESPKQKADRLAQGDLGGDDPDRFRGEGEGGRAAPGAAAAGIEARHWGDIDVGEGEAYRKSVGLGGHPAYDSMAQNRYEESIGIDPKGSLAGWVGWEDEHDAFPWTADPSGGPALKPAETYLGTEADADMWTTGAPAMSSWQGPSYYGAGPKLGQEEVIAPVTSGPGVSKMAAQLSAPSDDPISDPATVTADDWGDIDVGGWGTGDYLASGGPVGMQEGGMPMPPPQEGVAPPMPMPQEGAAADMANLGMVNEQAAPPQEGGQQSVQDDVPREADEGDYILPYETVLLVGLKQLNRYAREAIKLAMKNDIDLGGTDLDPTDDVPIKVSNYEFHIPKVLVPFFGGGKKYLDKIRDEGLALRKRLEEEQQPSAEQQQPQATAEPAPPQLEAAPPPQMAPPQAGPPTPQMPMMQKGGFVLNPNEGQQSAPTTAAVLEGDTSQQATAYNQLKALQRSKKTQQQPPMVDPTGKVIPQGFAAPQGYQMGAMVEDPELAQAAEPKTEPPMPDWANRALDPKTPVLMNEETGEPQTLGLITDEINKMFHVYPTIRMVGKELKRYDDDEALSLAMKKKDSVKFKTVQEADSWSTGLVDQIASLRDLQQPSQPELEEPLPVDAPPPMEGEAEMPPLPIEPGQEIAALEQEEAAMPPLPIEGQPGFAQQPMIA